MVKVGGYMEERLNLSPGVKALLTPVS